MGGTRRERAEETHQHLLASAKAVFEERGYRCTSVAAITEAASTAHGTFYLYFRNKEDVFEQLVDSLMEELYRETLTPLDPATHVYDAEVARGRVAAFLAVAERERGLMRALFEAIVESPTIAARWRSARERFVEGIAARLRTYRDRGELRALDVDLAAATLCGMLEWLVFTSAAFEVPGPLEASERVIDTVADLWASALAVGGPSPEAHA